MTRFEDWAAVLRYAVKHGYLLYKAPMDTRARRVKVVRFDTDTIRLDPMTDDADPFTADRTHLDRMWQP